MQVQCDGSCFLCLDVAVTDRRTLNVAQRMNQEGNKVLCASVILPILVFRLSMASPKVTKLLQSIQLSLDVQDIIPYYTLLTCVSTHE